MIHRSTILLVIVAVAAVCLAVIVERHGTAPDAPAPALLAPALEMNALTEISLARPGAAELRFVRADGRWHQRQPFPHPMDGHSLRQLAELANGLTVVDEIDDAASSARSLGLDPPQGSLRFASRSGTRTLHLGQRGLGGIAYLRLDDDPTIYVVEHVLHDRALEMDPRKWRRRTIFDTEGLDVDGIDLALGEARVQLKRERRRWRLTAPVKSRANAAAVEELRDALARGRNAGFVLDLPDDLARFGLADPAGLVTVIASRPVDGARGVEREPVVQRLRVGARVGVDTQDRFGLVEGRPTVVRLPEALLAAVFKPAAQLVATTASGVQAADVAALRIDGPGGEFDLQRDIDRWVTADGNRAVNAATVNGLLQSLTALPSSEIAIGDYPRELHVATVTMLGFGGRPLDTVRVAREKAADGTRGRWALENGDRVLRVFPASLELPLTPAAFRAGGR